jgi:DNA-binding response OmpR family regulator
MSVYIEQLEAEVARLRALVGELTASDRGVQLRGVLRLSPQEARLLALIEAKGKASRDAIYGAIFEDIHGDGPELKIVDVIICKLRRKLREQNATGSIQTVWGWGYELSPELGAWLADLTAPRQALAA